MAATAFLVTAFPHKRPNKPRKGKRLFSLVSTNSSQSPTSMPSRCPSPKQDISRSGCPPCRRSLRLACKSDSGKILVSRRRAKPTIGSSGKIAASLMEEAVNDFSDMDFPQEAEGERGTDLMEGPSLIQTRIYARTMGSLFPNKEKRRRKKLKVDNASDLSHLVDESGEKFLSLRSVKRGNGIVIGGDEEEGIGREREIESN